MSDKKTLATLRNERVTFLNKSNAPQPLRRNPYISHALYNAFDRLKRKAKGTRREGNRGALNRGAVLSNRGANLKRGSANRRATLNAKNKEKQRLILQIEQEIERKKARINRARRAKERAASSEAAAGASANAEANNNEAQEVAVEQEMDAIQELAEMMATLRIRNNNNSNNSNYNARDPWLRTTSYEEE